MSVMENNNYIRQELMEVSPSIVQIEKSNLYSVSPSYFDSLSQEIMEKIQTGKEPVYFFSSVMPYFVPEGYFVYLSEKILQKISQENKLGVSEELETISPLLNTINKKPVYSVPEGYFDRMPVIPAKEIKPGMKVISGKLSTKLFRYAIAAVFISILSVGMFLFLGKSKKELQLQAVTAEVQKLSDEDIVEFLKKTTASDEVTTITSKALKENDIKKSISEMSDKEIQQFLQESGYLDEI